MFMQDLQNSDCIVIQGSNYAEAHPVGFQWVMEAKARGATIIHVDPRFTRTSAVAGRGRDLEPVVRPGRHVVVPRLRVPAGEESVEVLGV